MKGTVFIKEPNLLATCSLLWNRGHTIFYRRLEQRDLGHKKSGWYSRFFNHSFYRLITSVFFIHATANTITHTCT